MAAQVEEVVVDTNLIELEYFNPYIREQFFDGSTGFCKCLI